PGAAAKKERGGTGLPGPRRVAVRNECRWWLLRHHRGRRQEQGSRAGETGHLVDQAGVGVGDAEGAGEDPSSGIARDDRRAGTGDLPATLGREAGEAGVGRAAELRDAALGVDAASLGVLADAGRAGAAGVAGTGPAIVVLGLSTGGVRAGRRANQLLGRARGERQLDVERGGKRVAQRSALARQQVGALAGDDHLAVYPAVVPKVLRAGGAL